MTLKHASVKNKRVKKVAEGPSHHGMENAGNNQDRTESMNPSGHTNNSVIGGS